MSGASEAGVLWRSGAAYRRRVGLVDGAGSLVFAGIKPGGFCLYFDEAPHFHYDLEGRWQRMFLDGTHYLKALDGTVDGLDRPRGPEGMRLERRRLDPAEVERLDDVARAAAERLREEVHSGARRLDPPPAPGGVLEQEALVELLDRVRRWDAVRWREDREAYRQVYGEGPLGFLPPGCPQAVVLRATPTTPGWLLGPVASPADGRSPDLFAGHARAVAAFLGRRAAQARGVVITGGDVLRRPGRDVVPWLAAARHVFPMAAAEGQRPRLSERPEDGAVLDGVYLFMDAPEPPFPGPASWGELRSTGLRRVDVPVVSGDPGVRLGFGHRWRDAMLAELVSDAKASGVGVGLLVPTGIGGDYGAERHVRKTAELLGSLGLGKDDVVYLVDGGEAAGPAGLEEIHARGCHFLDSDARSQQMILLREAMSGLRQSGVKVVPYTLEKQ